MSRSINVAAGMLLADRYEVRRSTPDGVMTFVEAEDTMFSRPSRVWLMGSTELCERHREVGATLTAARHPCLSPLHTVQLIDTADGAAVMVAFRHHDGPDLAEWLGGSGVDPGAALEVFDQVATAVGAVHRAGQSLGDVSSRSALLDADGSVYVADPLVAAIAHHGPRGAGPTQQRTDLNALVSLVIELLTGQEVPSDRRTPATLPRLGSLRPALAGVDRVLAEAVRPDRSQPPADELALRVRDALVAAL